MSAACGACRFAEPYPMPEPLPAPVEVSSFFGLIRWTVGPDELDEMLHGQKVRRAERKVWCARFPKGVQKAKSSVCGEFVAEVAA